MNLISAKTRILLNLFLPQRRKPNPSHAIPESDKDMSGKTVVFTGGTDGIGRVAVEMLYEMGANVVLLGRSKAKGEAVVHELTTASGQGTVRFQVCDLASMRSVKDCADRILAENSRVDVLVNCAGINMTKSIITEDGFETNWATKLRFSKLVSYLTNAPEHIRGISFSGSNQFSSRTQPFGFHCASP